jgi:hypothetical protein
LFLTPILYVRNSLDGLLLLSKFVSQLKVIERGPATLIDPGHKAHYRTTNMYATVSIPVSSFDSSELKKKIETGILLPLRMKPSVTVPKCHHFCGALNATLV